MAWAQVLSTSNPLYKLGQGQIPTPEDYAAFADITQRAMQSMAAFPFVMAMFELSKTPNDRQTPLSLDLRLRGDDGESSDFALASKSRAKGTGFPVIPAKAGTGACGNAVVG
jgi:hypothetical protein